MNYSKLNLIIRDSKMNIPEVAEKCGITKTTLYNILNGADPRISTVEKLAQVLGIPPSILFFDDNTIFPTSQTTGDFSPAVSGVQGDATVTISNEGEALQKERIAHLKEKVKHLQDIIDEKERLIKVLMETRR